MSGAVRSLVGAFAMQLRPPPRLALWQWANEHRRLSSEASAQPGQWTTMPFQVEPLECMGPNSPHEQVVLVWASQSGKSEMLLCFVAYVIAESPGPVLMIQPTLSMAEAVSKDRLSPMYRDTPALRGKVSDPRAREAGSTIYHRRFLGGHITLVGANSPAGLASRPIKYLLMDEIDRWEPSAGAEGDPASLALARTRSFWNRTVVWTSSPTVKNASRIEQAWLESDQRYYHVACPMCAYSQRLVWQRVEWPEGSPDEAAYRCAGCEQLIPHHKKASMVARGRWMRTNPTSSIPGFHLSELYSPWRSWGALAIDWLKAQGSIERLRAFYNTSLAEWWDDQPQANTTEAELLARREAYGPILPAGVALLVAAADCQDDRVEISVWGFGAQEESWLVTHRVFPGDPSVVALWNAIEAFLSEPWPHPIVGPMPIAAAAFDSGGHYTGRVCQFCDAHRGMRWWAIKGAAGPRPAWPKHQSKAPKGRVYIVGVDSLKQSFLQRLRIPEGPGTVHFPSTVDSRYFEQLLSEYVRVTYRRGRPERVWIRRPGMRAEALDCAVYSLAALAGLRAHGIDADSEAERIRLMAERQNLATLREPVYRSRFVHR